MIRKLLCRLGFHDWLWLAPATTIHHVTDGFDYTSHYRCTHCRKVHTEQIEERTDGESYLSEVTMACRDGAQRTPLNR